MKDFQQFFHRIFSCVQNYTPLTHLSLPLTRSRKPDHRFVWAVETIFGFQSVCQNDANQGVADDLVSIAMIATWRLSPSPTKHFYSSEIKPKLLNDSFAKPGLAQRLLYFYELEIKKRKIHMAPSVSSFNRYSIYDFRNFCAITQMNPDGTKRESKPGLHDDRHLSAAKNNIRDRAGLAEPVD